MMEQIACAQALNQTQEPEKSYELVKISSAVAQMPSTAQNSKKYSSR